MSEHKPTHVTVWNPRRHFVLPWAYAHVDAGSLVIHTSFGITRWHALGRAAKWAQKHGADGSLRVSRWTEPQITEQEGS